MTTTPKSSLIALAKLLAPEVARLLLPQLVAAVAAELRKPAPPRGDYLSPEAVRALKRCALQRVYRALESGALRAERLNTLSGKRRAGWLIKREDAEAWESGARVYRVQRLRDEEAGKRAGRRP